MSGIKTCRDFTILSTVRVKTAAHADDHGKKGTQTVGAGSHELVNIKEVRIVSN